MNPNGFHGHKGVAQLVLGHELIHYRDHAVWGVSYSQRRSESEVNAYRWEINNAHSFILAESHLQTHIRDATTNCRLHEEDVDNGKRIGWYGRYLSFYLHKQAGHWVLSGFLLSKKKDGEIYLQVSHFFLGAGPSEAYFELIGCTDEALWLKVPYGDEGLRIFTETQLEHCDLSESLFVLVYILKKVVKSNCLKSMKRSRSST